MSDILWVVSAMIVLVVAGVVFIWGIKRQSDYNTLPLLTGAIAEVTEPIPPRGYGEIQITIDHGVLRKMAACYGNESVIPLGALVVVDGIVEDVFIVTPLEKNEKKTPYVPIEGGK